MRILRIALLSLVVGIAAPSLSAVRFNPFGKGHEKAWQNYVRSLNPAQQRIPWMMFRELSSPPRKVVLNNHAVLWVSSCKEHDCGANHVTVFIYDTSRAKAIVVVNGKKHLLKGAGASESDCYDKLVASGFDLMRCS